MLCKMQTVTTPVEYDRVFTIEDRYRKTPGIVHNTQSSKRVDPRWRWIVRLFQLFYAGN